MRLSKTQSSRSVGEKENEPNLSFSIEDSTILANLTNELTAVQNQQQKILLNIQNLETKLQQNLPQNSNQKQQKNKSKHGNLNDFSSSLFSSISNNREKRDKITKLLEDRNKKVENTRKDLSDRKFRFERYRDSIESKEAQLKIRLTQLNKLNEEISELYQKNSELQYNLHREEEINTIQKQSYQQKKEELDEKQFLLEENTKSLHSYEERAKKHKERGQKQIQELNEMIESAKNGIKDNEEATKVLIEENQKLEDSVMDINYNIDDLNAQLDYLIQYNTRLGEQRKMFMKLHEKTLKIEEKEEKE